MVSKNTSNAKYTVPGLSLTDGQKVGTLLQDRLHALNDLQLTLKHAHWNVIGRDFIGVHQMLDPQIELVRAMIDETAERMATLGVPPNGLPGALVRERAWEDYPLGRATTTEHLAALDTVYDGLISSHREAISTAGELDPVTEDMLIGHTGKLELFQWFMRAHLENTNGALTHETKPATEKNIASKK